MTHPDRLHRLATRLARATPLLLDESKDWGPFYDALDDTLALESPDDEMSVIGTVVDHLREKVPHLATELVAEMLREFEAESEYSDRETQDGLQRGCVMFAIPFVSLSNENVPSGFRQSNDITDLEDILREAQVLGDVADFRLVPRVFSLHDLYGRTFGEYHRMVDKWATELLTENELDGAGPDCLARPSPAAPTLPQARNPYVQLHFLVGVLAAREADLPHVFPNIMLSDPEAEGELTSGPDDLPGDPFEGEPDVGQLSDGQDWEEAFCALLGASLELMAPPLAALMPAGFHEDLSSGLELEREVGLQHAFSVVMECQGLAPDAAVTQLQPAVGDSGVSHGWLVRLLEVDSEEVLEEVEWPQFGHEQDDDCTLALGMALHGTGVASDEVYGPLTGSRTIH